MECASMDCPLREDCGHDQVQLRIMYEAVKLKPCNKCNTTFYCSARCAQSDWFKKH